MTAHAQRAVTKIEELDDYPNAINELLGLGISDRGQHFNELTDGVPTNWVSLDDAHGSSQVNKYSFWYTRLLPSGSFDYYKPESGLVGGTFNSYEFLGLQTRDGGYTTDIDMLMAIHPNDGGGIPINDTYIRCRLQWESASSVWQVRAESKADAASSEVVGSWFQIDNFMPESFYIRLVKRTINDTNRVYFGYSPNADQQKQILNSLVVPFEKWNQGVIMRWSCQRGGTGVELYSYLDAVDETSSP